MLARRVVPVPFRWLALGAAVVAASWPGAARANSACLNDNLSKVCLDVGSTPSASVQPSGLAGQPTYVSYSAVLGNTVRNRSARNVLLTMSLQPQSGFVSFQADVGMVCSLQGSTISCLVDKLDDGTPLKLVALANVPAWTGATTAQALINTATFGWNGRTESVVTTVPVNPASGKSYVPANTTAALATGAITADPSLQVSASSPVWAQVTLPPRPAAYLGQISVIGDGPNLSCKDGTFMSKEDGGPYVCRDQGFPIDAGNPRRWVLVDTSDATFDAASPMEGILVNDPSIVGKKQGKTTTGNPTGTPPFAIFISAKSLDTTTYPIRAAGKQCGSVPVPPCVISAERFANGVWRARYLRANDGTDLAAAESPLGPLYAVMDFVVATAEAQSIRPPALSR
ncbi:MAG TPA: hypothetical protein VJM11_20265 [Nevskiaceae bacterium]|nr:hypothetical protein [Nevskiaceae bacterium]